MQLVRFCDDTDYRRICPLQKAFKEYVGAVIQHKNTATGVYYRDDPTILGWEIANAPVCPGDDTGDLLQVQLLVSCAHLGQKSLLPMLGHMRKGSLRPLTAEDRAHTHITCARRTGSRICRAM